MGQKKKQLAREFRQAAAMLPRITIPTKMNITGLELLKGGTTIDEDGNPIDSERIYQIDAETNLNHVRKMKKLYKKGGLEAVDQYVMENAALANAAVKCQEEILSGMEQRASQFSV